MTKYEEMLRNVEPRKDMLQWLYDRGKLRSVGIVYRRGDLRDPMTGLKDKAVRCTCSACGSSFYEGYIAGSACARYSSAPYGVWMDQEARQNGDNCRCPECGVHARLYYAGHIRYEKRIDDECVQELRVIEGVPVLLQWWIRKYIRNTGESFVTVDKYNAFVFEAKKAVRLSAYGRTMGNLYCRGSLQESKECRDDFGNVTNFLPFDPKILNGTVLENAKLDLYLQGYEKQEKYPVSYLRLYLRWKPVETLLTCGGNSVLSEMIQRDWENRAGFYKESCRAIPKVELIDRKKRRPSAMLGLNREEARRVFSENWSLRNLEVYRMVRDRTGERLDKDTMGSFGAKDVEAIINMGLRVGKTLSYIQKQKQSIIYYRDYWDMAKKLGHDMSSADMLYPKDLQAAHDQAMKLQKYMAKAQLHQLFLDRKAELSPLAWEHEGILIRPVADERELIDEGDALHHCVGTYAERHSRGECSILLIRKIDEPDKPWFTLNFNMSAGTVTENRGSRNCVRTPEVVAFETAWLKAKKKEIQKLQRAAKKRKEKTVA
ncbi:MAG: PcfJ domain-containing protein [Oscillospiraceae bacterium]|nr:PcfJ domain-containing protein [Oscillospiraceae bacterium]